MWVRGWQGDLLSELQTVYYVVSKSRLEIWTQFKLQGSISSLETLLSLRKRVPSLQTDPSLTIFSAQRASVPSLSLACLRVFSDCLLPSSHGYRRGWGRAPGRVSDHTCAPSLVQTVCLCLPCVFSSRVGKLERARAVI